MCGLWPRIPGFLKSFLLACRYVCMSVCVSAPEGINNQWHDMVQYRLYVIGQTCSTALQDIVVDKLERHGLSNTARRARQVKMSKLSCISDRRRRINYLAVATRRNTLVIRVTRRMCRDKFKRRLGFSFTVII